MQLDPHYSDTVLRQNLKSGLPGVRGEAKILLEIPHVDRDVVVKSANLLRNCVRGFRWTDALRNEATEYKAGRLTRDSYETLSAAMRRDS